MMSQEKTQRVKYLKESYEHYTDLYKYIQKVSSSDPKFNGVYKKEM